MTTKAICGACGHYGTCKLDHTVKKGNPWRCLANRRCDKRNYG